MQRIKDLRAEKKQNNLFQTVIWKNMLYNRKETILLIICETLIVAIAYSRKYVLSDPFGEAF